MIEIRQTLIPDFETVVQWIRSADECRLWCGTRVRFPVDLAGLPSAIEFADCTSWTAITDERIVAFGQLVPKPEERFHLSRLISAPDRRGTGLGRLITTHILQEALARGPTSVSLNVFPENAPALSLYESLGFRVRTRPRDEPESPSLYMAYDGAGS